MPTRALKKGKEQSKSGATDCARVARQFGGASLFYFLVALLVSFARFSRSPMALAVELEARTLVGSVNLMAYGRRRSTW
jgi:hypothetical protein